MCTVYPFFSMKKKGKVAVTWQVKQDREMKNHKERTGENVDNFLLLVSAHKNLMKNKEESITTSLLSLASHTYQHLSIIT